MNILLVEDERKLAEAVAEGLQGEGYEVTLSPSGEDALSSIRRFHFDLILLDVCMPGMEGSELAEKIHGVPFLGDVPIVFLTCIVTPSEVGKNGRVVIGHHEYMAKPARPSQLLACIQENLERANRLSLSGEHAMRS